MAFSLIPARWCESIYELTGEKLRARGITLLLLDLDNTLIPYGEKLPSQELILWANSLREAGVEPFILSNSRKPTRVQRFAGAFGVPFHRRAGKPRRGGFQRAMQEMGKAPQETAIVGDQIFTDILGGNRSGVLSILVRPVRLDSPFRRLRFGIETPFRKSAMGRRI